ncbi:MAG: radical SAM-associated putative lipoprotein [Bacteroidaceae bacterium]|nr:radical SAM-associated putative lipoprotein [Bacteroidaceae bacterium]
MKHKIFRMYGAVLSVLLTVLGFSSCSKDEYPCEYGSPNADYFIEGTVTDEEGNLINGILVSAESYTDYSDGRYWYNQASKKTVYGEYYLSYKEYGNTKLIVQDVDGEANGGEFASDTIDIDRDSAVRLKEGDNNWYSGAYKITQNIQLKKK